MTADKITSLPMYSVVIPLFNRADVITETVKSVLSQSVKDFEIVIVDDGSKDNPKHIIDRIEDSRIRYILQENKGGSAARNTGIDHATGKYIAFLDSDDLWLPFHLEQALPILETMENTCAYSQVIVERGGGVSFIKPPRTLRENEPVSEYLLCDRGFFQTSSLIIPAELARKVRFDETINYGQDTDFSIRIAFTGGKFCQMPHPSVIWKDHTQAGRISNRIDPEIRIKWLNKISPMITPKAYLGCAGWSVARGYARSGKWARALGLLARAILSGCYRPKMAVVVFLQVLLPMGAYRTFSDFVAKFGIKP